MTFSQQFLHEASAIIGLLDVQAIDRAIEILAATRRRKARLFILGVGGSAANASHAVNDFRKITGVEAYAPTDNVSELSSRTNDEGWASVFEGWLKVSQLRSADTILVLSVGGGNLENNVSPNLVSALKYAKQIGSSIVGIVGRDGGFTAQVADVSIVIPTVNPLHVTPHAEAFQAVLWHLMVSHPALKASETKWESVQHGLRRAVFLDRDGVLNRAVVRDGKPYPPESAAVLEIPEDVPAALAALKNEGFLLFVVTNQPDIARGSLSPESLEEIHRALVARLPIDGFFVCRHQDSDGCDCRKPSPGLLLEAASQYQLNLPLCYLVGDRWRDVDAGYRAGCSTIFLDYGYQERAPDHEPSARVKSLKAAADWILRHSAEVRK